MIARSEMDFYMGSILAPLWMATKGSLTRWFKDQLARELPEEHAYSMLYSQAKSVPAGSDGLIILPYFIGEQTPINDPFARGIITG